MASRQDTMMNPSIEAPRSRRLQVLLVTPKRAGDQRALQPARRGPRCHRPPQVTSVARKPLSIAFEEISSDKIVMTRPGEGDDGDAAGEPSEAHETE